MKLSSLLLAGTAGLALCAAVADIAHATQSSATAQDTMTNETTWPDATAPTPKKVPEDITQHDITRTDNYGWIRDDNWQEVLRDPSVLKPDVREYLEEEVAYYEAMTADLQPLRDTLFAEMRGRIKEDDSSVPSKDGPYEYFVRYREGGNYPIFARRALGPDGEPGAEQVLYDGDAEEGDSPFFSIGTVANSPDHELIAFSNDRLGSEYYTIHVRDAATGEQMADEITSTGGEVVWDKNSQGFFYVERDDNQRPKRVWYHALGDAQDDDTLVYEEEDNAFFLGVDKTQSGDYILLYSGDQITTEFQVIPADDPTARPVMFAPRIQGQEYYPDHHGDYFYIRTNEGDAVDFKIVRTPVDATARENWEVVVPAEDGVMISGMTTYADYLVREERRDARPAIVIADYDGNESEIVFDQPAFDVSYSDGREYDTDTLRVYYESPSQPQQTFDVNMASGERTLRKTQEVPSGHNPDLYTVEMLTATADDGAQIPVMVLRLRDVPLDGSAPVLLYGYGSYGAYISDSFNTNILPMVDRGVIYALAHVRGGSAKGQQWYLDGKLDQKMNTFTDFVTAGEMLVDKGYTTRGNIVSYGGSAGGLLVGAAVNIAPDLFGGVLGAVPFVDVISTISDDTLPLTPPEWLEWGNPITSAEEYGWIAEYSPYDNIKPDTEYPPILATGGLTDYRVTYWEPAKWVARLREEATGGPFLLRMNMEAGHGGSAARFERLEERAHLYAFALKIWGKEEAEPVSHGE